MRYIISDWSNSTQAGNNYSFELHYRECVEKVILKLF